MKIELTYQYRLYPDASQIEMIRKTCNGVRYIYNRLLEERTKHYREKKEWKKIGLEDIQLPSFLEEIDPGALCWAQSRLEEAYRNFFHTERTQLDRYRPESIAKSQKDPGYQLMDTDLVSYPRFKKKKMSKESYTTPLAKFTANAGRTPLPCLGSVKIRYHRAIPPEAEIMSCTVLKKPSGNYFLLVKFCLPEVPVRKDLSTPLGVAFVPGRLAVRSDGVPIEYRHQTGELQDQIDMAYKTLKRRKPGSKRYEKQRQYLASLYERRANQRRDDLHKTARQIANAADVIYMQKPDVLKQLGRMQRAQEKAILLDEASWTLASYVKYKAQNEGKWFWSVPKEMLLYSVCSYCGGKIRAQQLPRFTCPECGMHLEMYVNAARNLNNIGVQYIRALQQ